MGDLKVELELLAALARLGDQQREALIDFVLCDCTDAEIAVRQGVSPKTVKSARWQALEALRREWPTSSRLCGLR